MQPVFKELQRISEQQIQICQKPHIAITKDDLNANFTKIKQVNRKPMFSKLRSKTMSKKKEKIMTNEKKKMQN